LRVDQTAAHIPFRALTAQIAKDEHLSADTAAAHAVAPVAATDPRDDNPGVEFINQLWSPADFDELQPPERRKPTYDLAAYLARRCAQAYLVPQQIAKIEDALKMEGGSDFKHFQRFSDAAFGYRRGNCVVIAFRGTQTNWNALRQWPLTNLRAFPVRHPRRHLGFQMAWERLRPDIVEWIERTLPRHGTLIITGHSLGGAIAILAAFELAEDYHVRAVVTIGAPRVGLTEFRDAYLAKPSRRLVAGESAALLGEVTRRITHADDIVSRVPPGPAFRHVGEESRLDENGMLVPGESRGILVRLFAGLDAAVGWCYRQLDAQRSPSLPGLVPSGLVAGVQGTPYANILRAFDARKPDRPLGRLAKDMLGAQERFPYLSLVTLTALQWTLAGIAVVVSCGVLLLGLFDFRSHPSRLYVDALLRRYAIRPPNFHVPGLEEFMRKAFDRIRE